MINEDKAIDLLNSLIKGDETVISSFSEESLDEIEQKTEDFNERWDQDFETIGRVLKSHLVVEHYMTEFIRAKNPNLVSLDKARLSFSQKLNLLNGINDFVDSLIPGIKRLNKIRNGLAHKLDTKVTDKDIEVFLSVNLFNGLSKFSSGGLRAEHDDPLSILESFSKFVALIFQTWGASNESIHSDFKSKL